MDTEVIRRCEDVARAEVCLSGDAKGETGICLLVIPANADGSEILLTEDFLRAALSDVDEMRTKFGVR